MNEDRRPTLVVGNILSKLIIPEGTEFYYEPMLKEIDQELSFDVQGREHTNLYNRFGEDGKRIWDGRKHLINLTGKPLKKVAWKRYVTEPGMMLTGNLTRCIKVMAKYGVHPSIQSNSENLLGEEDYQEYKWNSDLSMRDYQRECIDIAVKKRRGLLQIATGGGKTLIAARIIQQLGVKPVVFFVTTKDLLYQAKSVFEFAIQDEEIGIIGDGKCEIKNINVATIQTIMKCIGKGDEFSSSMKQLSEWLDGGTIGEEGEIEMDSIGQIRDLLKRTRALFFDECQHSPADTCRNVIMECKNSTYRYGLSATPFREDGEDLTIEGLFGETLVNISASMLIEKGFFVQPQIILWKLDGGYRAKSYQTEYKEYIVENKERNTWIANWAQIFSNSGKTVLILVKQIKHGKILSDLIPEAIFIDGTKSSKKREAAISGLRNREYNVMIATTLADEGLDIPTLDVLILAGAGKSRSKALQRIGRVIRPSEGKTEAVVIDFLDQAKYSKKHASARKKIYKSEELFIVTELSKEKVMDENPDTIKKMIAVQRERKGNIL